MRSGVSWMASKVLTWMFGENQLCCVSRQRTNRDNAHWFPGLKKTENAVEHEDEDTAHVQETIPFSQVDHCEENERDVELVKAEEKLEAFVPDWIQRSYQDEYAGHSSEHSSQVIDSAALP